MTTAWSGFLPWPRGRGAVSRRRPRRCAIHGDRDRRRGASAPDRRARPRRRAGPHPRSGSSGSFARARRRRHDDLLDGAVQSGRSDQGGRALPLVAAALGEGAPALRELVETGAETPRTAAARATACPPRPPEEPGVMAGDRLRALMRRDRQGSGGGARPRPRGSRRLRRRGGDSRGGGGRADRARELEFNVQLSRFLNPATLRTASIWLGSRSPARRAVVSLSVDDGREQERRGPSGCPRPRR